MEPKDLPARQMSLISIQTVHGVRHQDLCSERNQDMASERSVYDRLDLLDQIWDV